MKNLLFIGLFIVLFTSNACAEPIRIGVIFAKTGRASDVGEDFFKAIRLLTDDINKTGGILNRPVELIEFDNQSTPLGSKQAALDAVKTDVVSVIGAAWSANTTALAEVFQKEGIPLVSPLATKPEVTEVGNFIFRVCFTDPFQGKVMAKFVREDLQAVTAAIFVNASSSYSRGLSQEFSQSFENLGGTVLATYDYIRPDTDFEKEIEDLHRLKPDVVYLSGYSRDSALIIRQSIKMGNNFVFAGGDGWNEAMYTFAGPEIDGNYFTNHWHPDNPNPISARLIAKYGKTEFKGSRLVLANDALMVLMDSITRAGSSDRKAIQIALANTVDFQGATGNITFDATGDPVKAAVILRLEKGSSSFVKAVQP
ncbi:amino acid/amide ABC transporter substrate-binding protein, HAAT family [Desulfocapsa sulfexigens DSM 10523]|uniref:Amino acid/amide ABC transporter substrate-binding protein, HAAT family n=1 Tax=Desulfocapsa sulfexigens (strain DSM 10523 / SB164P1) TaxID=1167006 RepID=M1P167_DESSD|nr:ABC transporter substrate-binding protein [Desulfocapsa sulfexigens]AGF77273.1 amino acid/amide ABC transporter substrate-binding protein, HAAT family [Desulfocapsa sulfexigens DSM 10523]